MTEPVPSTVVAAGLTTAALDTTALSAMAGAHPELAGCAEPLAAMAEVLAASLAREGTVFACGNGGSMADALHLAGELRKAFERSRPLPAPLRRRLAAYPGGAELADHLEVGLRVVVLGADPVLSTAIVNDLGHPHAGFAQELLSLGRAGDALLVISTSGRSPNVVNAALVARALECSVVVLTGRDPAARLVDLADVVVRAPGVGTAEIQGWHSALYHALCRVLEDTFYPGSPRRVV